MTSDIDRYAVFGNPVAHSKSPQIHSLFARQTGQDIRYTAEHIEPGEFKQSVQHFIKHNGKGLNITVPFKEEAYSCADQLSDRAQRAGAVNTLILRQDDRLYGETTDGIGLVNDLMHNHQLTLLGKDLLIIGAGGAVRGVIEAVLAQSPATLLICNRTRSKAIQLAEDFSDMGNIRGCGLDELEGRDFDIIINGTSASLKGDIPALPDSIFREISVGYDMMYGTGPTPFMTWSLEHGATTVLDGLGMLVEQAAESFYLWRGVRPDTTPVITAIRELLTL